MTELNDAKGSKRKTFASLAATTMHARHQQAARINGAKGGHKTAENFADGPSAWGKRMALARWHGVKLQYVPISQTLVKTTSTRRSRAPRAGRSDEGPGKPELRPASARKLRSRKTGTGEQGKLF